MRKLTCLIWLFIATSIVLSAMQTVPAASVDTNCKSYYLIYMRGSGQELETSPEYQSLKDSLINLGVNPESIGEIGSFYDGDIQYSYPAASVFGSPRHLATGGMATLSASKFGLYRNSVDDGKELLIRHLLKSNYLECGTRLILAGYSQGAHVIGESLFDYRIANFLPNISFVVTFGDPTLDSSSLYGGNVFSNPSWYRGNVTKFVSSGLLGVRNPYIPAELADRTGAWCHASDMVCSGNLLRLPNEIINKPHSKYPDKMIPEATAEIVTRLSQDLAKPFELPRCGAPKQDVVINLDLSPSMRADWKTFSDSKYLHDKVGQVFDSSCDTRVAIHGYWRPEDSKDPTLLLEFTRDRAAIVDVITALYQPVTERQVITPSQTREGILGALDVKWRESAEKVILTVSNAGGTSEGLIGTESRPPKEAFIQQPLSQAVLKKSRDKGGVELWTALADDYNHTLAAPRLHYYMIPFGNATGGRTVGGKCGLSCSWSISRANSPNVTVQPVRGMVGEPVALQMTDISGGVIEKAGSSNSHARWFIDCDNQAKEEHWASPGTSYFTFKKPQFCMGSVVYESNYAYCYSSCGGETPRVFYNASVTTFPIEISEPANTRPSIAPWPIQNLTRKTNDDHVIYNWEPPANADDFDELAYVIRDEDGVVVGITRSTRLHIVDVPERPPRIYVSAFAENVSSPPTSTYVEEVETDTNPTPDPASNPPTFQRAIQQFQPNPAVLGVELEPPKRQTIQLTQRPFHNSQSILGVITNPVKPKTVSYHAQLPQRMSLTVTAVPLAVLSVLGIGFVGYNAVVSLRKWR